jgi:hypothetical protein
MLADIPAVQYQPKTTSIAMKVIFRLLLLPAAISIAAGTAERAYESGQAYQRNQYGAIIRAEHAKWFRVLAPIREKGGGAEQL